MTLKTAVQKLVPYSSAPYAEHVFKQMNVQGNAKVSLAEEDNHVAILKEAAERLRDLVKELANADEIRGYIVYREENAEELARRAEEDAKAKEVAAAGGSEINLANEEEGVADATAAIIRKFKGKILKEFVPHFLLQQYQEGGEDYMIYESFDQCVDEYFSQAEKQREAVKA